MSQLKPNLVRNWGFADWDTFTAGQPDFYRLQGTSTTLQRLLRTHPRDHPFRINPGTPAVRQAVPSMFKSSDYILEGPGALRAVTQGAAVDVFRIWPWNGVVGQEFDNAFLGPFRVITGTNDVFRATEAAATADRTVTQAYYQATTLAAELVTQLEVGASTNTYTWAFNPNTRLWTVTRATGTDAISILWSHANTNIEELLGYDAVDDVGLTTYTGDSPSPSDVGGAYRLVTDYQYSLEFAARCSVDDNLLRLRVALLDPLYVAYRYLRVQGAGTYRDLGTNTEWFATAASIDVPLTTYWKTFAVNFAVPAGARYLMWQLSNGSSGSQILDLGRVRLSEQTRRVAQEGAA